MILKDYVCKACGYIEKDGNTDYVLVIPNDPLNYETVASLEICYFFEKSTGAKINVVSEDGANGKKIYLGNCVSCDQFKKGQDYQSLNEEGFIIKTYEGNVYIAGKSERGTLFGAYKFLEKIINYRYYAIDCIKYDKKQEIEFLEFDYAEMPDIEQRTLGFYETFKVEQDSRFLPHLNRLRLARTLYTDWIFPAHSYFQILPKEKYFDKNRDYYSPDGQNLCLSNLSMRDEFFENLKTIIENNKGEGIMLGQEDNFEFCNCPKCTKRIEEDGTPTGVMMEFSNDIARRVRNWLNKKHPTRKLHISTFAYNSTAFPPVKKDANSGEYVPLKVEYVAEDNLSVMVVPRNPAQSKSWFDEEYNLRIKEQLLGWKAITKKMRMWTYCVNYDHFMINFPNIYALKENYTIFKDVGGIYMFDQGSTNFSNPTFDFLRQFLQSNLLWDTSLSTDDLIDEFMQAYYMEEAPKMKEYFVKVFTRWEEIERKFGVQSYTGGGSTYYLRKDFWDKKFIDECLDLFREMRGDIERFATIEDWDKYVMLKKRILTESLSIRYLLLNLYGNHFGEDLAVKLKYFHRDCNICGVKATTEGGEPIEIC